MYCSHFSSKGACGDDLSCTEWLAFFEELRSYSVLSVTLSGGEPLIYENFKAVIEGIVSNRMQFSILTNGTLITEELALFLEETKRCNSVQVSLDGSCPEVHDRLCGKGAFDKASTGIKNLRNAGINTTVRITINKQNLHDIERTAALILNDMGLPGFSVNSASYLGSSICSESTVMLNTDEYSTAMQILYNLDLQYPGRISAQAGPLYSALHWPQMVDAAKSGIERFPNGGALTACGCVWNKVDIRSDGVITPCIQIPHIELGRINRDSLLDIWHHHPVLNDFRSRKKIPLSRFEECRKCPYIDYCTGSCPATAYTYTGKLDKPSPDACLRLFLEDGGRLPVPHK